MRQFDRRLAYHFDWLLMALTLAIIAGGLATIFSATEARVHVGFTSNPLVMRQAFYAGVGFLGMIAVVLVDIVVSSATPTSSTPRPCCCW